MPVESISLSEISYQAEVYKAIKYLFSEIADSNVGSIVLTGSWTQGYIHSCLKIDDFNPKLEVDSGVYILKPGVDAVMIPNNLDISNDNVSILDGNALIPLIQSGNIELVGTNIYPEGVRANLGSRIQSVFLKGFYHTEIIGNKVKIPFYIYSPDMCNKLEYGSETVTYNPAKHTCNIDFYGVDLPTFTPSSRILKRYMDIAERTIQRLFSDPKHQKYIERIKSIQEKGFGNDKGIVSDFWEKYGRLYAAMRFAELNVFEHKIAEVLNMDLETYLNAIHCLAEAEEEVDLWVPKPDTVPIKVRHGGKIVSISPGNISQNEE